MRLTFARTIDLLGAAPRRPLPLGNKADPTDELFYILLTVMTRSQPRIDRAFAGLIELTGGDWTVLPDVEEAAVRRVLEPLGFVNRRYGHLRSCAMAVAESGGSVDHLRSMSDEAALAWLLDLPGVGVKSAKCVLLYSLDRAVLPVDIHVLRVAKRLGLLPPDVSWQRSEGELERLVPADLKFDVHVRFVEHGRTVCTTRAPRCGECVLRDVCPSVGSASELRADYT